MGWWDALQICSLALLSTSAAELISYSLLHRTSDVKDKREALKARLEEARRSGGVGVDKIRKELANLAKRTGTASALSLVLTVVVATLVWQYVGRTFDGYVVALLPFDPPSLVLAITHHNLVGHNVRQCSYHLLFILSGIAVRANLQRLLGVEAPVGMLEQMQQKEDK